MARHPAAVSAIFAVPAPWTTALYTLSLHDALPIWQPARGHPRRDADPDRLPGDPRRGHHHVALGHPELRRSEEHTSELQSHSDLVCRLMLEKKKTDARRRRRLRR